MKQFATLCVTAMLLAFGSAVAQTPYAGMQTRSIKALSDQQIADLRAGRGMGLALAAELNGYPGPNHLLELADRLGLSDAQRHSVRNMFEAMKAEAVPIGGRLIEQETQLNRLFAERQITPASLRSATEEIGATQARLREAHLKYHLAMMTVLSADQITKYQELRGYGSNAGQQHHPHRHN